MSIMSAIPIIYSFNSGKLVKNKEELAGNEMPIPRSEWVPFTEINNEQKILAHSIFDKAFNRIMETYTPRHEIALFSLCTSTRPYNHSRKWKQYVKEYGEVADLIVVSNGGIIPYDFWGSYPFLNYDGPATTKCTSKYKDKLNVRLRAFLEKFNYKHVIANFRPNLRNTSVFKEVLHEYKNNGTIEDYIMVPDEQLYKQVQAGGFPKGKLFPHLDPLVQHKIQEFINKKTNKG